MRLASLIVTCLLAGPLLVDCTLNPQPQPPCDSCDAIVGRGPGGSGGGTGSSSSGGTGTFTVEIEAGADSAHATRDGAAATPPPSAPGSTDASSPKGDKADEAGIFDAREPRDSGEAANPFNAPTREDARTQ